MKKYSEWLHGFVNIFSGAGIKVVVFESI